MNPFAGLEEKAVAVVRDLIAEAEHSVPAVEAAVTEALHEAGAPPEIASVIGQLVKLLKEHFAGERGLPEPAPEPEPDPGVPGA